MSGMARSIGSCPSKLSMLAAMLLTAAALFSRYSRVFSANYMEEVSVWHCICSYRNSSQIQELKEERK